jgi:hypothetical protein
MGTSSNYQFPYPNSTDPIKVSDDMQRLATKVDDRLVIDSTRNQNSLVLAEAIDVTQYLTWIVNTTSATQLFSVPITQASVGDLYVFDFSGSYQNNTGANRTFILSVDLGSTNLFTGTSTAIATSTALRTLYGQIRIHIDTLSAQIATSLVVIGGVGQFSMNTASGIYTRAINTATEDLSTAKNLTATITHSIASEDLWMSLQQYSLVRIGA